MKGKLKGFIFCVLFLLTAACGEQPTPTVDVVQTATPFETVPVSLTATPSALPTLGITPVDTTLPETPVVSIPFALPTTAVDSRMPADFSPILYGKKYDANMFFVLLGAVQGNTWLTPDQAAAQFAGGWDYDVHTSTAGSFQVHAQTPEFSPTSRAYFLGTDSTLNEFGMVGVLHGWTVTQGKPQELSPDIDVYQQIVLDWLKTQGLSSPELGILHIFRVDLEADGVDEIFLSATHLDESQHTTKAGDYSVVLMRKVTGNSTVTLPLAADVYHSQQLEITYPPTYSLANFIDLNRDGVLEVVVNLEGWETFGGIIYQVDGQNVTAVLR